MCSNYSPTHERTVGEITLESPHFHNQVKITFVYLICPQETSVLLDFQIGMCSKPCCTSELFMYVQCTSNSRVACKAPDQRQQPIH
ncbi:hypothetical protein CY34DRAFT_499912 [Suillus luteus UH-Slu-Lm8-n1]|uniref:Uncharacterized protein n=1 Tax=Suillus luteus UH-Slu-Lm8-n1 TaxID=930992 RepID=A0A0D0A4U5_9AGAM|nr:hypothetical protein CY34DRAFT_499912 [Suillus luteus UH-Slu-Lm8-n1]